LAFFITLVGRERVIFLRASTICLRRDARAEKTEKTAAIGGGTFSLPRI
jgi:hypothetical protein